MTRKEMQKLALSTIHDETDIPTHTGQCDKCYSVITDHDALCPRVSHPYGMVA